MADTDFTLEGPKWGSSESGTAGGTVTWAVDSSIPEADLSSIKAALAEWSAVANIQFQEVASTADANIDFKSGAIDGAGSVLGETGFSFSGGQLQHADVEFDSGDNLSGSHLTLVAAHEIGHAIGLGHFDSAPAVMNSAANFSLTGLTQSDIDGIQTIYGANTTTTSDAGATPDNPNPDPANGTGGTGTSGTPAPGMTAGSGAAGGCDGMETASGDDGTASAAGSGAGDGSFHHGHGAHHGGGSHANDVAALLQALQGDHAGAAGSAAGDGGFQHGHGGAASNDLAALLQTMQSDHARAVTASANEVHSVVPADMGSVAHAHFEHMWT